MKMFFDKKSSQINFTKKNSCIECVDISTVTDWTYFSSR